MFQISDLTQPWFKFSLVRAHRSLSWYWGNICHGLKNKVKTGLTKLTHPSTCTRLCGFVPTANNNIFSFESWQTRLVTPVGFGHFAGGTFCPGRPPLFLHHRTGRANTPPNLRMGRCPLATLWRRYPEHLKQNHQVTGPSQRPLLVLSTILMSA